MMEKSTPARHECPVTDQFTENHVLAQTRLPHRRPLPPSRLTAWHASRNARNGRNNVVHHLYQTFYRFDFGPLSPSPATTPRSISTVPSSARYDRHRATNTFRPSSLVACRLNLSRGSQSTECLDGVGAASLGGKHQCRLAILINSLHIGVVGACQCVQGVRVA